MKVNLPVFFGDALLHNLWMGTGEFFDPVGVIVLELVNFFHTLFVPFLAMVKTAEVFCFVGKRLGWFCPTVMVNVGIYQLYLYFFAIQAEALRVFIGAHAF